MVDVVRVVRVHPPSRGYDSTHPAPSPVKVDYSWHPSMAHDIETYGAICQTIHSIVRGPTLDGLSVLLIPGNLRKPTPAIQIFIILSWASTVYQ